MTTPLAPTRPVRRNTIAAYYFPGYHAEPRNEKRYGSGWTEWRLLEAARPRFPGHNQPLTPLWGAESESDPKVMARKIQAAADHGVDVFLFDWYWYGGPFLNGALDEGYLKANNRERVRFALMWANHNWAEIFPRRLNAPEEVIYPGAASAEIFDKICDHIIADYFSRAEYWRVDGGLYFSIYDLTTFLEGFGNDVQAAAEALRRFRQKTAAANLGNLHLNLIYWQLLALPGSKATSITPELAGRLGFDSVTSYVWIHHVPLDFPTMSYDRVLQGIRAYTLATARAFEPIGVPYFPNVSVGWDSSPRTDQKGPWIPWEYPFTGCISDSDPKKFRDALRWAKEYVDAHPETKGIVTINSWNEWTEGSYLEPDTTHRFGYLEAIREVFGTEVRALPPHGGTASAPPPDASKRDG